MEEESLVKNSHVYDDSSLQLTLLAQGAEARIYASSCFLGRRAIVKERFSKTYRHAVLDTRLTERRTVQEARSLVRALKAGVDVPTVYLVDKSRNRIFMEHVNGITVKDFIWNTSNISAAAAAAAAACGGDGDGDVVNERRRQMTVEDVAMEIGRCVAALHDVDVIHGDLTTSNMMIRDDNGSLTMIDFGLSSSSNLLEDKGVDLYVLERAFVSTHPDCGDALFAIVLDVYSKRNKRASIVLKKFDEVRMRGRKRSMVG